MFAYRIELANRGAGFQELARDLLFCGQRQSLDGRGHEGGGSTGDQTNHQIARPRRVSQIQNVACAVTRRRRAVTPSGTLTAPEVIRRSRSVSTARAMAAPAFPPPNT